MTHAVSYALFTMCGAFFSMRLAPDHRSKRFSPSLVSVLVSCIEPLDWPYCSCTGDWDGCAPGAAADGGGGGSVPWYRACGAIPPRTSHEGQMCRDAYGWLRIDSLIFIMSHFSDCVYENAYYVDCFQKARVSIAP